MDKYQVLIEQLSTKFTPETWRLLLNEVNDEAEKIYNKESGTIIPRVSLTAFIRAKTLAAEQKWFEYLSQMLDLMINKRPQLLKIFYRTLPAFTIRYIQINFVKQEGLEDCLMKIYNYEYRNYNEAYNEKVELSKDLSIRKLYQEHLSKEMSESKPELLKPLQDTSNVTKGGIRVLICYLIYREASNLMDEYLADYYRAVFIYCGADEKQVTKAGSLYLLEKTNMISIFRYSITEEELDWIILSLYELCTQVKKDKFELLAAINVLHKKAANQCLFKMSEVAQSLIHLLEDQYSDVFM